MSKQAASPVRRLFFDIETSPNIVLSWRVGYKLNIDHSNLLEERGIICIGYKWQGDKKARVLQWDENQCDKALLAEFSEILGQADEIVGHNIDRFDLPWVKTRCIIHGLDPLPEVKTADTLQWARRRMYFNSNRLDYIAKILGFEGKIKTDFKLWKDIVLAKCPKAMAKMSKYCAWDVELLEKVWEKLATVSPVKTHAGVLNGHEKWTCPRCAGEDVKKVRRYVTAAGTMRFQMKCNAEGCGGFYNISKAANAAYEEFRTVKA